MMKMSSCRTASYIHISTTEDDFVEDDIYHMVPVEKDVLFLFYDLLASPYHTVTVLYYCTVHTVLVMSVQYSYYTILTSSSTVSLQLSKILHPDCNPRLCFPRISHPQSTIYNVSSLSLHRVLLIISSNNLPHALPCAHCTPT